VDWRFPIAIDNLVRVVPALPSEDLVDSGGLSVAASSTGMAPLSE
jgi:hypothetical protein